MSTRRPFSPREKPRAQSGHFALFDVPLADKYRHRAGAAACVYIPYRSWHVGIFTRRVDLSRPAEPPLPLFFPWRKLKYISRKPARFYCPISRRVLHSAIRSIRTFIAIRECAGGGLLIAIVISAFSILSDCGIFSLWTFSPLQFLTRLLYMLATARVNMFPSSPTLFSRVSP